MSLVISEATKGLFYAAIVVVIYGTMYRENPFYSIVEHAMIGTAVGQAFVADWAPGGGFARNIIGPMLEGKVALIIPIIIGLLYFSVFSKRLAWLYRTVIAMRIGSMLGIAIGAYLTISMLGITTLARKAVTHPVSIIGALSVIFTLFYFTFSAKVDEVLGIGRRIGYWVVFIFYAGFGATLFLTRLDTMVGWVYITAQYPAILIVIAGFILVLIDAFIRRTRRIEVPAT